MTAELSFPAPKRGVTIGSLCSGCAGLDMEAVLGRSAPAPTETGTRGQPRLSAALVEWMMGLPFGWVTDPDLGLPRTAQLQALGNGVVPQQAQAAVRHLLASSSAIEAGGLHG